MLRDILNQFLFPIQLMAAAILMTIREERRPAFFRKITAGFMLFVIINALVAFFSPYNILIKYAAVVCYIRICFDVNWGKALFDSTCAFAAQHLAYQISMVIATFLRPGMWGQLLLELIIFSVVYLLVYYGFVTKLQEYQDVITNRAGNIAAMSAMLFIAVFLTSFTTDYPPANVISGFSSDLPPEQTIRMLLLCCSLYSITCCVFILWVQISGRKELKLQHDLDVQKQLWLNHKAQYEMSKENIAIINQKCHDLKHQIEALRHFYTEAQREEYLDQIEKSIMIYDSTSKAGNDILDTILTEKKLLCEKDQIELTCVADGACLSFLDPIDLYAILTNALNNAMEAVKKLADPEQRFISLKVYGQAGVSFIQVENYFPGTLRLADGLPETTKEDKEYHGYGLRSIRYNVEKYGGYMSIDTNDDMFVLRISIPAGA